MKYNYSLSLWLFQIIFVVAAMDEKTIKDALNKFSTEIAGIHEEIVKARWDFEMNRTESTEEKLMELYKKEAQEAKNRFREINAGSWNINDGDLKKQFRKISDFGFELLPEDEFITVKKIQMEIETIEKDIRICDYNKSDHCHMTMRDVRNKMAVSKNPEELKYFWAEWRKATSYRLRTLFQEFVKLSNKAARLNNFTNFEEYLLKNFRMSNVKQEVDTLWEKIKPLYLELHAYVRRRLSEVYGGEISSKEGSIPGYLLGDLWPENWHGIYYLVTPYPNQDDWNKTGLLINKGFNVSSLQQQAEEFFTSMKFPALPNLIWVNGSSLADCREGVFDMDNSIRILYCGDEISLESALKFHRLMAKAQYTQQYKQQPFIYQEPADPGLEKALSDVPELSYLSLQHMKAIGLHEKEDYQSHINRLMEVALRKIASIPSILATEFWRWGVFSGEINEDNYDCKWEETFRSFEGISTFTNDMNFDPGGLSNIFSKTSLIHGFIGSIAEFQIYNSLCQLAGAFYLNDRNLDDCDLYQSTEAGLFLRNAMKLGSSNTPTNILEMLTAEKAVHVDSLLEYFQPLMKWLQEENKRTNEFIGWKDVNQNGCQKNQHRRKRSLEYLEDEPESSKIQYIDPDRFQGRSRRNDKTVEQNSERHRKSSNDENQKTSLANNDKSANDGNIEKSQQKPLRRRSIMYKQRRAPTYSQWNDDGHLSDDYKKTNKFKSAWYGTKNREPESYETNREKHYARRYVKKMRKRGEAKDEEKKDSEQSAQSKSSEDNKSRSARKAYHVRNDGYEESPHHRVRQRKNADNYENEKESKEIKMHTNAKKDISRLLHSFGFSVENDNKDKNIKELKKNSDESEYEEDRKVSYSPESAVWGNQEMKKKNYMKKQKYSNFEDANTNSNINNNNNNNNRFINTLLNEGRYSPDMANEGTSYESVIDINRLTKDKLMGYGPDKSRVWSINDFLNSNGKYAKTPNSKLDSYVLQNGKVVGKKDILSALEQASKSAVKARADDQGESIGNIDMDVSSLQNLLKTVNLNALGQNQNNEARFKSNPFFGSKGDKFKEFRFTGDENSAFKDRKEFKEEDGNKSPFIIIVGQITPEMKERLLQGKGNLQPFFQSFANGEKSAQWEDTQQKTDGYYNKNNGKREDNEKIYIVPINVKANQHNLVKPNKFTEHEHETGHENTERDQETEEQYHLIDNSKLDDRNAYRREKEYPSEVYVSWEGFDKNKRIARRIKREHKKQKESNADMKSVKLVPMKESTLERLLGNGLDHLNLDDKSLKMLANGLSNLEGTPGQASLLSGLSSLAKSQGKQNSWLQSAEESEESKLESNDGSLVNKELKDKDSESGLTNPTLRCNTCGKNKNATKCCPPPEECCKKVFVLSCPPKCPCPCPCPPPCPPPCPLPCPLPCPCPCPPPCPKPCPCPCPCPPPCGPVPCPLPWPIPCPTCPSDKCDPVCCEPKDICCKKPSECSMVNCQFKITKAKKPHERLTIMIYDRINPPEELPEPYDALAVISEVLQKIQCQTCKPPCPPQLTEEDPDYPANDNTDQLKAQTGDKKNQENNEETPNLDNPEEEESDDNSRNSAEGDKSQSKEKATPALDQLTVFNKDKLAPVLLELRKIDDLIKKRNP